jgi:hypothetical protein
VTNECFGTDFGGRGSVAGGVKVACFGCFGFVGRADEDGDCIMRDVGGGGWLAAANEDLSKTDCGAMERMEGGSRDSLYMRSIASTPSSLRRR